MDEIESQPERTDRWDTVSFVISSHYRVLVLDQLANGPEILSRITTEKHERVLIEHVSRAVRELRDRELVELRVPEEREKHRLYGLTEPLFCSTAEPRSRRLVHPADSSRT